MKNFLLLVLVSLVFWGCSKENSDLFIAYNGNPANDTTWLVKVGADAPSVTLHNRLTTAAFIDSLDPFTGAKFQINENAELVVPPKSLVFTDGSDVTGKVKTEVRHLSTKGDFIRFAKATTSYGLLLETAGMFYVNFLKGDQQIYLKPGKRISISMKDAYPVNTVQLFKGIENLQAPMPVGTNLLFNWAASTDSSNVAPFTRQDSTGTVKGYKINCNSFGWFNCQSYLDTNLTKTNLTATLPVNFTNRNTTVFAVVKQRKIVVQLNGDYSSRTFFAPNIPAGSNVLLVSLSLIGNQMYLGVKDANVTTGAYSIINPVARTQAEIITFLKGL